MWLNMLSRSKDNNVLGHQEFCISILLQYISPPQDLPTHCDSCSKKFSLSHALDYKTGRTITDQHDEVSDKLGWVGT
eukprot:11062851-Ditylum_brightwellii.AAC.1